MPANSPDPPSPRAVPRPATVPPQRPAPAEGQPTATEAVTLRTAEDGGELLLPYVVALLDGEGGCRPVPARQRTTTPAGGLELHGEAHGFTARLRLGPPLAEDAEDGATTAHRREAELTVRRTAAGDAEAALRVELRLGAADDPGWLVPGVCYGQNRLPECARPYPRYAKGVHDPAGMTADAWSFRADRCATPAVFARDRHGGAALSLAEQGELGEQGVGFALLPGDRPALRLHAPYREEPISYYGTDTPLPPQTPTHLFRSGAEHTLRFTVHLLDADPHAYAPVLRGIHRRTPAPGTPAAWVSVEEAAELAAHGLHRWHYRDDPPVLLETAAFDR